jgi:hypothetical protein
MPAEPLRLHTAPTPAPGDRPPAAPPPAADPLERLLAEAARRATDPALRRWLLRLLRGESARGGGR